MVFFDLKNNNTECPPPLKPSAVALGIFDGVHLGHRRLLLETVSRRDKLMADGLDAVAVVWSLFEQPNKQHGENTALHLTSLDEKLRLFAEAGIDYAVLEHFDDIRNTSPEDFVSRTLLDRLNARTAVCGFNFRFGKSGAGDANTLLSLMKSAGADVSIVPAVTLGGGIVSSSRIRCLLENGETEEAAELLGRPFSINLPVVHGKQLGRTLGIPTINQNFPEGHIIPKTGIYACTVCVGDDIFPAITNIGCRPTFDGDGRINSETHIIDYDGMLYGETIRVSFYKRLRDEIRFSAPEELTEQIKRDAAAAGEYFSARGKV